MIVEIKGNNLTAKIKTFGGELSSLIDNNGTEYIWNGNEKYWGRQAPLLFPAVGRFAQNKTLINGKEYEILGHGFIRDYEFDIISKTDNSVTLECNWNEETYKRYPFKFCFRITYTIENNALTQSYYIKNLCEETMPFALGGHTGFNCPIHSGEKFEDYRIEFQKTGKKLFSRVPDSHKSLIKKEEDFDLGYKLFADDALIFENIEADAVKLINRNTENGIKVSYKGFTLLGIWTPYTIDSPFICIEPWLGMTDKFNPEPIEMKDNPLFENLSPNHYAIRAYEISII